MVTYIHTYSTSYQQDTFLKLLPLRDKETVGYREMAMYVNMLISY